VSEDNGITFNVQSIPGTTESADDPAVAVGRGDKTNGIGRLYEAFASGNTVAGVAVSDNRGLSWKNVVDVGSLVGIKAAAFRGDPRPVEEGCPCPTCRQVSRAFLHHAMRWDELTGQVLATLHNLRHYLDFMARVRESIALGTLAALEVSAVESGAAVSLPENHPDSDRRAEPEPVGPGPSPQRPVDP